MTNSSIQNHNTYIAGLLKDGTAITPFECCHCKFKLSTVMNNTHEDWDSLVFCPSCDTPFLKITLRNNQGVRCSRVKL